MNYAKAKLVCVASAVLVALATMGFASCAFDGQGGNLTINLPPISSRARAIAENRIEDLKSSTASYCVTVETNGQRIEKTGAGGRYSFNVSVGVMAQIAVECLNKDGDVIVRAKKTHRVYSGVNNVNIKLAQDGDVVETGSSTTPAKTQTLEEFIVGTWILEEMEGEELEEEILISYTYTFRADKTASLLYEGEVMFDFPYTVTGNSLTLIAGEEGTFDTTYDSDKKTLYLPLSGSRGYFAKQE